VGVGGPPQVDQVCPPGRLVVLDAHPPPLLVAGELLTGGDLASDEAVVVVRGRVDQVADDLLLRPAFGGGALFVLSLGEAGEDNRQGADGKPQAFDGSVHLVHPSPPCVNSSSLASLGLYPSHRTTGWGGYFGKAGPFATTGREESVIPWV